MRAAPLHPAVSRLTVLIAKAQAKGDADWEAKLVAQLRGVVADLEKTGAAAQWGISRREDGTVLTKLTNHARQILPV